MNKYTVLVLFSITLISCAYFAFFPPVPGDVKSKFQSQSVSSSVLEYGETGKILKKIRSIYPYENLSEEIDYHQNIVDVVKRAEQDRKKWLQTGQYRKFRDTGIYCYIEINSVENKVPVVVSSGQSDGWRKEKRFHLKKGLDVYPFFLDISSESVYLDIFLGNTKKKVEIRTIVFLKHGYHPIVFYEPVSYLSFLRNADKDNYSIKSNFIQVLPKSPGSHHKFSLSFRDKNLASLSAFQKKQGRSRIELTTRSNQPIFARNMVSDGYFQRESTTKLPILAIDISEEDLYSEAHGLFQNFTEHGRDWERIAHIRYFQNGETAIQTFAGLRIQGGDPGREQGLINFRVYFRDEYGESFIEKGVIFPESTGRIKRLAVKQSEWEQWPLNSPIGYDIGRQAGALTPPTEMIKLYLNGIDQGLYYLVPHLGEKQVSLMFPDKNLRYFRHRGSLHDADHNFLLEDFWFTFTRAEIINQQFAEQHFDMDGLMSQIISIIFAGTGDFCQGLILKDMAPESKMFWYMWDMDHSFLDIALDIKGENKIIERWEKQPSASSFFKARKNVEEGCPREYLIQQLVKNDSQFREKAIRTLISTLNHQLTDEFLSALLESYSGKLEKIKYPYRNIYIERLKNFFSNRREYIIGEVNDLSPATPLVKCRVFSEIVPFQIDGNLKSGSYEGYHFVDEHIEITVENGREERYVYVNDAPLSGNRAPYLVEQNKECLVKIDARSSH